MGDKNICPKCGAHLDPGEPCDCGAEEKAIEEKRGFICRLKILLLNAEVDLVDLKLIDMETVEATYVGGGKRRINIAIDNKIGIIRDVAKNII